MENEYPFRGRKDARIVSKIPKKLEFMMDKIFKITKNGFFVALFLVLAIVTVVNACHLTNEAWADCSGYSVSGGYSGGETRKIDWNVTITVDGNSTRYNDTKVTKESFEAFGTSGSGAHDVSVSGSLTMYEWTAVFHESTPSFEWVKVQEINYNLNFDKESCEPKVASANVEFTCRYENGRSINDMKISVDHAVVHMTGPDGEKDYTEDTTVQDVPLEKEFSWSWNGIDDYTGNGSGSHTTKSCEPPQPKVASANVEFTCRYENGRSINDMKISVDHAVVHMTGPDGEKDYTEDTTVQDVPLEKEFSWSWNGIDDYTGNGSGSHTTKGCKPPEPKTASASVSVVCRYVDGRSVNDIVIDVTDAIVHLKGPDGTVTDYDKDTTIKDVPLGDSYSFKWEATNGAENKGDGDFSTGECQPPYYPPEEVCFDCKPPKEGAKMHTWPEMLPSEMVVTEFWQINDSFCLPWSDELGWWDYSCLWNHQIHVYAWVEPFSGIVGDQYVAAQQYGTLWILPNAGLNPILIKGTHEGSFAWADWPSLTRIRDGGVTIEEFWPCTHPSGSEWEQAAGDWHDYWKPLGSFSNLVMPY